MKGLYKYKKCLYVIIISLLCFISFIAINGNFNVIRAENNETSLRTFNDCRNNYTDEEIANIDYFCLKDDNIIFTPNQNPLGTCWIFSGIKSIESALSLATNEIYDFSEAWISLVRAYEQPSYYIGMGGIESYFMQLVNKYGLVLERDMPYEILSKIDSSSSVELKKYYDYYSQFANKDIVNLLTPTYQNRRQTPDTFINFIKKSIINNGTCEISFNSNSTYKVANSQNTITSYYSSSNNSVNHAVSAIGWDDNITLKSDPTVKGAFIVQNSWGNREDEGYIYIFYQNKSLITAMSYSVDLSQIDSYVKLTKSNSNFKNWYSGIANANESAVEESALNQGNIFYTGDNLDLTYSFINNTNYNNVKLDIFAGDKLISDINIQRNSNLIHLTKNNLSDTVCYKLRFHYDVNSNNIIDSNEEVFYKQIFVTDGIIIDGINGLSEQVTIDGVNKYLEYTQQAYQTHSLDINDIYVANEKYSIVYIGSYSQIKSIEEIATSGTQDFISWIYSGAFASASYSNYSTGTLQITYNPNNLTSNKWYTNRIKFTTVSGQTKILNIHYIKVNDFYSDIVWLNYLTDYEHVKNLPKFTVKNSLMEIENANDYDNYEFVGWYLDPEFTIALTDNALTDSQIFSTSSKKSYFNPNKPFSNVALYPKYELNQKLEVQDITLASGEYGTSYNQNIDCITKGSGSYEFSIVSGNLPAGLQILNGIIVGTPTVAGNFEIMIKIRDTQYNIEKECKVTLNIEKRNLIYRISKTASQINEELQNVELQLISGSIYNNDKVVSVDLSNVNNKLVGVYDISIIQLKSECYNISLSNPQDAKYEIVYKNINVSVNDYVATYDGKEHKLLVSIIGASENECIIQYSTDNINYVNEMLFKNATDNSILIYVKIQSTIGEFETVVKQSTVFISKVNLTANLKDYKLKYNFEEQLPDVIFSGIVNNETIEFDISGASKTVGKHLANIQLKGEAKTNYNLLNNSIEFEITKITPRFNLPNINNEEILLLKKVGELELPTVPDGFLVEILNANDDIVEGDNVVKFKVIPVGENAEIYETLISEYHIEKQKEKLKISNQFYIVLAIIGVLGIGVIITIIICKNNANKNIVNISFVTNSTLPLTSIKGKLNQKQSLPIPFKPGSKFVGWYVDKELTIPYKDNGKNKDIKLYAKWEMENRNDYIKPDISSFQRYKK